MNSVKRRTTGPEEAMELTTFKLNGSLQDFIKANADVDEWLATQRGFRVRRIAVAEDGTVFDMLLWDSVAHGEQAAERLPAELPDSPVHALIEQRTVRWRMLAVHHSSGGATKPAGARRARAKKG